MTHSGFLRILSLPIFLLCSSAVFPASGSGDQLAEFRALLDAQQSQLGALQKTVEAQQKLLNSQQVMLESLGAQPGGNAGDVPITTRPTGASSTPGVVYSSDVNAAVGGPSAVAPADSDTGDVATIVSAKDQQRPVEEVPEDPNAAVMAASFPGGWALPGSNAALRIGGYVKMNFVNSFDPLIIQDRFIVGSIPSDGESFEGAVEEFAVTAQQSRVNLDLREQTAVGSLRAFVEGDFAGSEETFRLRHAFGQFGQVLAGKTWSTLMDLDATPEEVDFEGVNGRINVRQAQMRFFPRIGKELNLSVALEDPAPDVSGGTGISKLPDVVLGLDRFAQGPLAWSQRKSSWSARTNLIARQIKARAEDVGSEESATGWGIVTSGRIPLLWWGERDQFLWQLIYGEGIGRYINDLSAVGGQDAVFSPEGKLKALPVFAGYLSYQHWWNTRWRSNTTLSWVNVDVYDFQSSESYKETFGPAYDKTLRASINLLFTPVHRVELGGEILWGERQNGDNSKGSASQLQMSVKYLY